MVRGRWKKLIRMVDEQEGCEWMNVSTGTGSPGQTQTKGLKMVVCVSVFLGEPGISIYRFDFCGVLILGWWDNGQGVGLMTQKAAASTVSYSTFR